MHRDDENREDVPNLDDRGEFFDAAKFTAFTATTAKNEFGQLLDMVNAGRKVVITKHDTPKAVILSVDEFKAITEQGVRRLNALTEQFDALLADMQKPETRAGMEAFFDMTPEQLGEAAVKAARKRPRS